MFRFLKLIKFKNLLLIIFTQLLFRYGFLKFQEVPLALSNGQFLLLILACLFIAAAAYLINSTFENTISLSISENKIYNYYVLLNIIGVGIGFYLSNSIGKPNFSTLFIGIAATSYLYASSIKHNLLIENIINAFTLPLCILTVGIFDLLPSVTRENKLFISILFQIMIDYSIFCFIITFIKEILTDLENVNTDYNHGKNTLPILLGIKRTTKLVFILSVIPFLAIIYYIYTYIFHLELTTGYSMLFLLGPLLFLSIKTWMAKTSKDYNALKKLLNGILILGLLSILIISLNKKYYA